VDCLPVAVAIRMQADRWREEYGKVLREVAVKKMVTLEDRISQLNAGLDTVPSDLMTLKHVLAVIAEIRERKMVRCCTGDRCGFSVGWVGV
jgi:hypothetical protein